MGMISSIHDSRTVEGPVLVTGQEESANLPIFHSLTKDLFKSVDALLLPVLFSPFMWYLEPDYIKLELVLSGLAKFSTKFGSRVNEKVKKVLVISHGYASPLLVTVAFLWKKRIGRSSLMVGSLGTKY